MLNITTIGIILDSGVITPTYKISSIMKVCGIALDSGLIPPKNYFKPKISIVNIGTDPAPESKLAIQIM